ncbi:hypothetical protein BDP55DRAFT_633185 [Colletotrichum godetiae]|uniref:Methyltransferase domain-containing protein n=1 Tax=Colletotrichum godetiae TaxID=1209918 RepID=A0AAJ0AI81_9PEZI|nr:uncharacterized protein BDP55DRAFT_633185 [Colletotrichum godetiae]KAK1674373.1 hypothetical protein BDP55DRAFT_633185 [Colletotrichum godetiae]
MAETTDNVPANSTDHSLASLRSSILDYRRENGRTYHRVSDGKYYLPNDETEQDRLVKGARRVLDAGAGTGIWALDYGRWNGLKSLGTRMLIPKQAYVEATFPDTLNIIEELINLEPGGYREIQDNEFPIFCDDGSMPADSQVLKWTQLIVEALDIVGKPMTIAPTFKQLLEDAGFEDVQGRQEKWPISPWQQKDPRQRELGICSRAGTMEGIEPICMALFTRMLGWTREEVLLFCAGVREELK